MARWRNRPQPGCWVLQSFLERTQPWKPSLLHRKNAWHYQSNYPLAAETALESTYMDDSLDSVEGEEKGIELCHCWVEVNPVHFKSSRSTVKGCSLLLWQQGRFMVDPRTRERFWPLCWICEIQMYTDPAQWQHVPTEQNLADLGSRGTGPVKLAKSPLWWDGPEWLSKSKRECPKLQLVDHPPTIVPEMKTGKKQETEFTAYVSLYTNQPQNVTKLYQTATNHGRLEIGSKVLLQLELISPCLCKSEGELFSTCQESKKGKSIRCCYCMKVEKQGTRWCGHASVKHSWMITRP